MTDKIKDIVSEDSRDLGTEASNTDVSPVATHYVHRSERGWAGHFICSHSCLFRRNTLLQYNGINIVVSTVGAMLRHNERSFDTIGHNRYYETMAFHSDKACKYLDINVSQPI